MSTEEIFVALGQDGYEYCHPLNPGDFEVLNRAINGEPKGASWAPLAVELINSDNRRQLRRSDSPWLGDHALIFRAEAALALGEALRNTGELLPLACRDARLFVFNPLHALPALDEQASSLTRFDNGRVMMVQKYVFVPDVVRGVDAFKLTNLRVSPTFVSRRFVDAWKTQGMAGLTFKQVA
jgi:hypothetical protein